MNEQARQARNAAMLRDCHPAFAGRLRLLIERMEAAGFRPRIQQAWRSPHEQMNAFTAGKSKVRWGFHCACSHDGKPEALAADVLDDDSPLKPQRAYVLRLAAEGAHLSLRTGVEWGLTPRKRMALAAAIAHGDWNYGGPADIGWDPCHVEPADLTVAMARNGARPTFSTPDDGVRNA
jgi:hypothetical protein